MKVIGITGVIASGKTSVSQYIKEKGYRVFDADYRVKRLYRDKQFLTILKKKFPSIFIGNSVSKILLANIVFKNRRKLKKLEQLIHPIIEKQCDSFIKRYRKDELVFLDVPLLFEAEWDKKCDCTIVVSVDSSIQKQRFVEYGLGTLKDLENRMHYQLLNNEKVARANFVIDNNESKEKAFKQVDLILKKIKKFKKTR